MLVMPFAMVLLAEWLLCRGPNPKLQDVVGYVELCCACNSLLFLVIVLIEANT